jgi:chromosome segregation ATPase
MEPYNLSRKQRHLHRGDRQLRSLEKEQLRAFRDIKGTLEIAKKRLEKRREWLRGLEEALQEEEMALKELQEEFVSLVDEAVYQVTQTRIRIENNIVAAEQELAETESQLNALANEEPELPEVDPPDVKVYVQPLDEQEDYMQSTSDYQARVQWYYPAQSKG